MNENREVIIRELEKAQDIIIDMMDILYDEVVMCEEDSIEMIVKSERLRELRKARESVRKAMQKAYEL